MGQAKNRGSFEERQAQAQAAERAKHALREQRAREARAERIRQADERALQEQEARRLHPKFAALPAVLQRLVLQECQARGVEPLWLNPPPPERAVINPGAWPTPRGRRPSMGAWGLIALGTAIGGRF